MAKGCTLIALHAHSRRTDGTERAASIVSARPLVVTLVGVLSVLASVVATATATTPDLRGRSDRVSAAPGVAGPTRNWPLPRVREYVALGDSWTAGVVVVNSDGFPATDYAPIGCAQSHRNYPKLVARELGVRTFRDASCGSATTVDFRHPQDVPIGAPNPAQFDRLTKQTDLVTVGIGGNDVGIAAAGLECLNLLPVRLPLPGGLLPEIPIPIIGGHIPPLGGCKDKYTRDGFDRLGRNVRKAEPKLVRTLRLIRKVSPRARILVVDYMEVIPDHACYPLVPATDEDMRYIRTKFDQLNAMLRRAARRADAEFVSTATRTRGHDLCTGARQRYAETLGVSINDPAIGFPAHPNAAGERAQAASVLDYLRAHPE
jgi:hypothetical protein